MQIENHNASVVVDIVVGTASNHVDAELHCGWGVDPFKSLTEENIYDALQQEVDMIHFDDAGLKYARGREAGATPPTVIGRGSFKTLPAREIERMFHALEREVEVPFDLIVDASGKEVFKVNPMGKYFRTGMGTRLPKNDPHVFSEEVQLFLKERDALGIDTLLFESPKTCDVMTGRRGFEVFNELLKRVRVAMRGEDFITCRRRRCERARRNFLSATRYVDALFGRYVRLLVLRVDLGYKDWTRVENDLVSRKTIQDIRQDLMHFLNNRRSNSLFNAMVGYVAKIEHGTTKGFHAHAMFFFDGSKVQRDAWLAGQIGEYWSNVVTKGEGLFYNCNAHKARYRRLGIGRIEDGDIVGRGNLLLALSYITKADQYLAVQGDSGRTFFRGVFKPRTTRGGRPRGSSHGRQG